MRILIDTQCWLWMHTDPSRFSARTREQLTNPENDLLLSAASAWEIAIKYALGKLPLPVPAHEYVPSRMATSGTIALPISHEHALRVSLLPPHHRDPFDRLIVAQAQLEGVPVLTADILLAAYQIELFEP